MANPSEPVWAVAPAEVLARLDSSPRGLSLDAAMARVQTEARDRLGGQPRTGAVALFLAQFKSPIILILMGASLLSIGLRDATDAGIILGIVLISALLGFWQETNASKAVQQLLEKVRITARVWRDGTEVEAPFEEVVRGDVVDLSAGRSVPGDGVLLSAKELYVNEASLTGETFPVAKQPGLAPAGAPPAERPNMVFLGTNVVSGTGRLVVTGTGRNTELGRVSERLRRKPAETEFERGVRRFGYLLMELTFALVIVIIAVNTALRRPALESVLFALALAVGLTPQLLPAIIMINLSHGARRMAKQKVIVRRLNAIENFGSMNVLCSDKTGTLTEGAVRIHAALDAQGRPSESVMRDAYINAALESGFANPVDEAIRVQRTFDLAGIAKLDEIPYDFYRKRLSLLVSEAGRRRMITKGSWPEVLGTCQSVADGTRRLPLDPERAEIEKRLEGHNQQGFRIIAVAVREEGVPETLVAASETGMILTGFLLLEDPPKAGIAETVLRLKALGVEVKMITGDNRLVAAHVGRAVGLRTETILTGADLSRMSEEALPYRAGSVQVFAEIEPVQKERVLRALQRAGNVVGYLGDGINDAAALHAADVGISVDSAADAAKASAAIVLLENDLEVLEQGVREGRNTFANTLKYVFMATSANLGNMFSMAGASLVLPFLPLLPKQILLTNLLTDIPEMTIASDRVDAEWIERPHRWNIRSIRAFMLTFGPLSSIFDFVTFAVLLWGLRATPAQFRTGWFLESVISAAVIVLIIRSRKPAWRSRPGRALRWATLGAVAATLVFPYTPLGAVFNFAPLPGIVLVWVAGIVLAYAALAEAAKRFFFRHVDF